MIMNGKMWENAATQENVEKLKSHGVEFIGPEEGMDANEFGPGAAKAWLQWWNEVNRVLALDAAETLALPPEIEALVEARRLARLAKNWQKSDELRTDLNARGWEVRDTKDGQKIIRRAGPEP